MVLIQPGLNCCRLKLGNGRRSTPTASTQNRNMLHQLQAQQQEQGQPPCKTQTLTVS